MFTPSPSLLPHTAALYRYVPGQDSDAGAVASETSLIALAAPCSVQPVDVGEEVVNRRVRQTVTYEVFFADNFGLKVKDLIVWVDDAGTSHNLFVVGQLPQVGLPTAWEVKAREVL